MDIRAYSVRGGPLTPRDLGHVSKRGVFVVEQMFVEIDDPDLDYDVRLDVIFSSRLGRFIVRGLQLTLSGTRYGVDAAGALSGREVDHREITSVLLRTVKVTELLRLAAPHGTFVIYGRDEPPRRVAGWGALTPEGFDSVIARGTVDQQLPFVALVYAIAFLSSEPAAKAVERTFGLPPRTASDRIKRARDAGLLDEVLTFEEWSWTDGEYPEAAERPVEGSLPRPRGAGAREARADEGGGAGVA